MPLHRQVRAIRADETINSPSASIPGSSFRMTLSNPGMNSHFRWSMGSCESSWVDGPPFRTFHGTKATGLPRPSVDVCLQSRPGRQCPSRSHARGLSKPTIPQWWSPLLAGLHQASRKGGLSDTRAMRGNEKSANSSAPSTPWMRWSTVPDAETSFPALVFATSHQPTTLKSGSCPLQEASTSMVRENRLRSLQRISPVVRREGSQQMTHFPTASLRRPPAAGLARWALPQAPPPIMPVHKIVALRRERTGRGHGPFHDDRPKQLLDRRWALAVQCAKKGAKKSTGKAFMAFMQRHSASAQRVHDASIMHVPQARVSAEDCPLHAFELGHGCAKRRLDRRPLSCTAVLLHYAMVACSIWPFQSARVGAVAGAITSWIGKTLLPVAINTTVTLFAMHFLLPCPRTAGHEIAEAACR